MAFAEEADAQLAAMLTLLKPDPSSGRAPSGPLAIVVLKALTVTAVQRPHLLGKILGPLLLLAKEVCVMLLSRRRGIVCICSDPRQQTLSCTATVTSERRCPVFDDDGGNGGFLNWWCISEVAVKFPTILQQGGPLRFIVSNQHGCV